MKIYKHYGVDVSYQIVNTDFRDFLEEKGVTYTDVPILDTDVIMYTADGINKYACIEPCADGGQQVFITTAIPEDLDFNLLMSDIKDQNSCAAEPLPRTSKLYKIICAAQKKVYELHKQESSPDKNIWDVLPEKPDAKEIASAITIMFGYSRDDVSRMESFDIGPDFYKDLLNHLC